MEIGKCLGAARTVTAADVTAGTITIPAEGVQARGAMVQVRTAAGVIKAWDGAMIVDSDTVTLDNSGAVDWAATDVINLIYF